LISSWKLLTSKGAQGLIMRKTLLGKFVGVLLAFFAVGSMIRSDFRRPDRCDHFCRGE
jgi:hypothetical protein